MIAILCALAMQQPAASVSDTVRYHFALEYVSDLDRRVVGGTLHHGVTTMNAVVSMSARDSAEGSVAHFAVDSVSATPTGAATAVMDPSAATWAKGAFIEVFVVNGRIVGTPRESPNSVLVHLLVPAIELLFKSDWNKAVAGTSWTDTSSRDFQGKGSNKNTRKGSTVGKWSASEAPGDGMVVEQTAVTSWVTDAKTDMNGNPIDEHQVYSDKASAKVLVQRDGKVRTASSHNSWESKLISPEIPGGVPANGSIAISVQLITTPKIVPAW